MKKALFITAHDIYDKNGNGGVKASQRNLQFIKSIFGDENVVLVTFPRKEYSVPPKGEICFSRTQNDFSHLLAALMGCKVYFPWNERKIFNYIKKQNIKLLFIDSSMLGRIAQIEGDFCKLVFFHNSEADYAFNKVKNEGLKFYPSYWASKYNEKIAMKRADKIVCLNQRDRLRLKELYGRNADYILPITLKDTFEESKVSNKYKERLLFVGSYMPQNISSIQWFINNVMTKLDDTCLDVIGKGFEIKKSEFEKDSRVSVIGSVEDLGKYYYSHRIVVLPILYGAGMKVKTAEAMMYGMDIIASDEALEGYDVEGIDGIYRCNSADEYVNSIKKALNNLSQPFNKNVRNQFLKKYESSVVVNNFRDFIQNSLP